MNIGKPIVFEFEPHDNGIAVSLYDANGFSCGGVEILNSGVVAACLISGDNEIIDKKSFNLKEDI